VQVNKSNTHSPKTSLVHIPKVRKETTIDSVSPLLVEMSCGFLSFVFDEGYSQESIEATLLSFQFRAGAISEEEFLLKRREVVGKDFENLKAWLDTYDGNVLPGSPLQIAINYPLKRWEALTKFLDFSFANSENNSAERKINVYCNWT